MSRESMALILINEIYQATTYEPDKFKPMDPRRVKRLANIYEFTCWNNSETVNRLAGAMMNSIQHRKERRIKR